jgi:xylan 1,4-beta-xylosidase
MNMGTQLRDIDKGFSIVASYPTLKHLPVIIGESDPEGCAACSEKYHPQNAYRNGTMYSSYTAAAFSRIYELAAARGIHLAGAVTWAFEFENQPWFAGFRDLATNGVDKPVLNVFRMFGKMQGQRVAVTGQLAYNAFTIRDSSVRGPLPDINALAAAASHNATVMVWNYHDNNSPAPAAPVVVNIQGIPAARVQLQEFRIDAAHSNAYEVWKKMGSPQQPAPQQVAELEKAGRLQATGTAAPVPVHNGTATVRMQLPRQAVFLLQLTW